VGLLDKKFRVLGGIHERLAFWEEISTCTARQNPGRKPFSLSRAGYVIVRRMD
jgi:hypothetical protein